MSLDRTTQKNLSHLVSTTLLLHGVSSSLSAAANSKAISLASEVEGKDEALVLLSEDGISCSGCRMRIVPGWSGSLRTVRKRKRVRAGKGDGTDARRREDNRTCIQTSCFVCGTLAVSEASVSPVSSLEFPAVRKRQKRTHGFIKADADSLRPLKASAESSVTRSRVPTPTVALSSGTPSSVLANAKDLVGPKSTPTPPLPVILASSSSVFSAAATSSSETTTTTTTTTTTKPKRDKKSKQKSSLQALLASKRAKPSEEGGREQGGGLSLDSFLQAL